MAKIAGYDIVFTLNGKDIVGQTSSSLAIAAKIKESLTKADKGNTRREVVGQDITFSVDGVMELLPDNTTQSLDSDALIELAMAKGEASVIPFVNTRGDGTAYKGNCIITNYSETANAEGEATYSLSCSVSGEMTKVS